MPRQLSLKWVGAILVVLLLSVAVYAFNGSYAPTEYLYGDDTADVTVTCPGEINGEVGESVPAGIVNIWMNMTWNEEQAQNVRGYSSQDQYYTHDITDMSDNLNGWCLWTDFPSPYYDWDDDDSDEKWEESEVVAVDASFPVDAQEYHVRSAFIPWYWKCVWQWNPPGWVCEWEYTGTTGFAFITPAVSKWQGWPFNEYQTVYYDDDPVIISYGGPNGQPMGIALSQVVDAPPQESSDDLGHTSISTIYLQGGKYTATVAIAPPNVSASLNVPLETTDLAEYANWSRSLTGDLGQSGLEAADVVVTFSHHVAPEDFVELVEEYRIDIDVAHAEYIGTDQRVWTAYIRNLPGTDFGLLDEAAQEVAQVDLTRPHGVVAVYGTAPVEQIDRLNQDSRVFLADPVGGYVSLVASQQAGAQETLDAALQQKRVILYQHIIESAEETARRTGQRTEDLLDSIDIEQAINAFFDQNPEQLPQVDIQVYDLWNVLAKEIIDLPIAQGYPALTIGNHSASSVHVAVSHYNPNGDWISLQSMIIAGDETVEIHPAHGFSVVVATQEVSTSVEWQQSPTKLPFVIYLPVCFDAYSSLPKSY
jgi:hypothetical protein